MSIRWLAHRYLLKQSIGFYQNEFAGRIATKVMQSALAVRETVMKLLDVAVYILVYFTSMLVIIASSDWRLMIPMLVWLGIYIGLQIYFISAAETRLYRAGGCAFHHDRTHCRQLHQYFHREAVFPHPA